MGKNWKALALSGAMLLSLCACGIGDAATTPSAPAEPTQSAAPEHTWNVSPTHTPVPEPTPTPFWTEGEKALFFHTLPMQFSFLSGAGGWSTELYLNSDESYVGNFTGQYHDSNMGDEGEGYQGSVYYCNFTGKFTQPERLDEFVYSVKLEELAEQVVPSNTYLLHNVNEGQLFFGSLPEIVLYDDSGLVEPMQPSES